jgi:hypothetical protein
MADQVMGSVVEVEATKARVVRSVGVIVYNIYGRVLMGAEGRSNTAYGKRAADYTFPWETEEDHKPREEMITQALQEEGGTNVVIGDVILLLPNMPVFETRAAIYVARFLHATNFRGTAVATGEIQEPGMRWCSVQDFFPDEGRQLPPRPTREGVTAALTAYANWYQERYGVSLLK